MSTSDKKARKLPAKVLDRSFSSSKVETDDDEKPLEGKGGIECLGSKSTIMAGLKARARSITKGGKGSGRGDTYAINVPVQSDLTPTSGVMSLFFGGATLVGASDWSALISLFDVVRCTALSYSYQPRGPFVYGSAFSTGTLHQPMMVCGDDDAVTFLGFSTLAVRDHTDSRNKFTNTWKAFRGHCKLKRAFNAVASTPASVKVNMANWMDTSAMGNASGGLLVSARTEVLNAGSVYGVLVVSFHCEFSTRL